MRMGATVALMLLVSIVCSSQTPEAPKVGAVAPDFTLPYATRDSIARTPITLSRIVGKRNIVIAFYPADWSGGCTKEMCTMRDNFGSLESLNAEVLPISGDYVFAHHQWARDENFQFKLLSDHLHTVAKEYGSFNEKNGFNRRTVFVVDKQGTIAYEDLEYSVADSVDFNRLKDELAKLK